MIPEMNPRVSHMLDKLPTTILLPSQYVPFLIEKLKVQLVVHLIEGIQEPNNKGSYTPTSFACPKHNRYGETHTCLYLNTWETEAGGLSQI